MKVVLFAAGLGTRIRDYSDNVPKPLVPVAGQPIVGHLMDYYARYGHRDFILCLGYKAEAFHKHFQRVMGRPTIRHDFMLHTEVFGDAEDEHSVTLVDTGELRNIGQRLWSVRDQVQDEEVFLANYSDGLTDVDLDDMLERFEYSGKVACFLAVRPPLSYHVANIARDGSVSSIIAARQSDIWINGGFFFFRPELFDYMREGEELVVEPFQRLIEADQLMAYKHEGFWQSMDTTKDRQVLEEIVASGKAPWLRQACQQEHSREPVLLVR